MGKENAKETLPNVFSFHEAKARKLFSEAYLLHIEGSIRDAVPIYLESIKWHPTAEAYTFLAWALSSHKEFDKAIDYCKKAIELDPDYGNPYNDIGAYLIELGRDDEAIDWLKKAIAAKKYECRFYSYFNLGKIYEERNHIMKAITCYEAAVKINPDFQAAQSELSKLKQTLN